MFSTKKTYKLLFSDDCNNFFYYFKVFNSVPYEVFFLNNGQKTL